MQRIGQAFATLLRRGRVEPPLPRPPRERQLTLGEKALAAAVFGQALDTRRVTVRGRKWWLFQPRRTVMAPNGHIYFHPRCPFYRHDFGIAPLSLQALFIHELTHVWQYQSGRNLILSRGPFARYRYLPLTPGKPFAKYGIEQQAEIVRHGFVLSRGGTVDGAPPLAVYRALIRFGPLKEGLPSRPSV
ncbi:vgr related protein [Pedomonas mirosovicensis]|uniref:vgr related protein n=1 Tax=Pedomonas mirosovicensis TaxID=2908641 RepID=UPI00216733B6|nr:vgr related protein [Pedomonas mirosovicensis]MCH8684561.1 vgr related protein [Pedomonas mirosovicensis]